MDGLKNGRKAKAPIPPAGRNTSLGLNLGLAGLAGSWLAVLAYNREARIERWLAAGILLLVGFTGLAIRKRARPAPGRENNEMDGR